MSIPAAKTIVGGEEIKKWKSETVKIERAKK
jgi:hypothetical protein